MHSLTGRLVAVGAGVLVVVVGVLLYVALYLTNVSGAASATTDSSGATHLYLATVAAAEPNDAHPTWVSYYDVNATATKWSHDTTYVVPAHAVVQITIYQFDTPTGLRNPFLAQSTGTIGNTFQLDGKTTQAINPDDASHVFAIPEMGVSVPLKGADPNAKNPCSNAPCDLTTAHRTITFSIRTPGPGLYRWQCYVPCGAGFIQGFGGPMQTVGYMDGFIKVV